jgi:microcystin-dependent protein
MGSAGAHTHPISVTINPAGAADAHENRPPYYAIAFIMRL